MKTFVFFTACAAQTNNTQLFPVWMQIVALAIVALLVIWVIKSFLGDILTAAFSKTITTQAILNAKTAETFVTQRVYASGTAGNVASGLAEKGAEYTFHFTLANGKHLSLLVPKDIYDVAVEGVSGNLSYKGKAFIAFDGATRGTKLASEENPNNFVGMDKDF